jgi:L-seryl-tRNA(Ser) seleniumtransferase
MHGFIGFETATWGKSFGRPMKVDRQTIVAVVTALQEWLEMDHDARLAGYEKRLQAMASELEGAPGVSMSIVRGEGPAPRLLRLALDPAQARSDAAGLVQALLAGSPAIAVGRDGEAITVNPVTLREEDDGVVVSRLGTLLL